MKFLERGKSLELVNCCCEFLQTFWNIYSTVINLNCHLMDTWLSTLQVHDI